MQLSMNLRNWGPHATRETLLECVRAIDDSTLDTVWINERLALPPDASPETPTYSANGRTLDPLATLAFLAAVTRRVGLGTATLNLPFRPALPTAKWLASVHELSNGRVRLGVGTGWMPEEFRALGVDPTRRGALTDEALELFHRCFEKDVVEVNGQPIRFQPRPPRPPFYIGGAPPHALRRAVRYGDGWLPAGIEPAALRPAIGELREMASAAGRPMPEVIAMKTLPLDDVERAAAYAREFQEAGVRHLVHTQGHESPAAYRRTIAILEERIRPALASPA